MLEVGVSPGSLLLLEPEPPSLLDAVRVAEGCYIWGTDSGGAWSRQVSMAIHFHAYCAGGITTNACQIQVKVNTVNTVNTIQ
jgi:hypothetical protein